MTAYKKVMTEDRGRQWVNEKDLPAWMLASLTGDIVYVNPPVPSIQNPPHYTKYKIEPKTYIMENGLGWCEGNVVKYITRWQDKGGVDDLHKAKEFIQMLIEREQEEFVEE